MSIGITAKANRGWSESGFLRLLHAVALTAVVIGAMGSTGLMIWVGHRNPSRLLLALFVIWDLSPFIGLVLADMFSRRWSVITRATLYGVMLILTLGSLALYADVVLRPRPQPAFRFLVVPLGSWLLMTIVVPIAALISGRLSRRGAGA
jgi:biotin transporter BioY